MEIRKFLIDSLIIAILKIPSGDWYDVSIQCDKTRNFITNVSGLPGDPITIMDYL